MSLIYWKKINPECINKGKESFLQKIITFNQIKEIIISNLNSSAKNSHSSQKMKILSVRIRVKVNKKIIAEDKIKIFPQLKEIGNKTNKQL